MKTILFFDRCDLTRLYILLTKELKEYFNIIHVAYSQSEVKLLKAAGIDNYIDYQKEISNMVDTIEVTPELIAEIDILICKQSNGRFTMNGSIQSDRGFEVLNYEEALKVASCHYCVWKNLFSKQKVDIMYHEPCSMFMTHIAALLCKNQGGKYLYPSQYISDLKSISYLNIDGETNKCPEIKEKYEYYSLNTNKIDIGRCDTFLKAFRSNYNVFMGDMINKKNPKIRLYINAVRKKLILYYYHKKFDRLKNTIDYWSLRINGSSLKLRNLSEYKKKGIKFYDKLNPDEKYYYYSMHLEPEAAVLYLGEGGLYTNQVKLIENIAASLPAGYYLYVKDHPHEFAYRKADDYERLQKIPNIRLIHQGISGKKLINGSYGVFTINGTAGFEGLLMGKQVYCFGETYYSCQKRVNYVKNIKDLKNIVYRNQNKVYENDLDLYAYICAYLESMHPGFVSYFGDRPEKAGIDQYLNASIIAKDIIKEFNDEASN